MYYDGNKLLSLSDINGNKPELYLCTTNRTAGKTTYFSRLLVNKFIKNKEKFCLLYRFNYELDDCADKFFKDIQTLFFTDYHMESASRSRGIYHELFLNDEACGYAISINNADMIKKTSHFFSDVDRIMFDEFQSENAKYCPDEVTKFISVHTSIARGQGKQTRYVPVYMIGNTVSLINPYYVALGISNRLSANTKFLKGNGWVLEQGFIESAAEALKNSGFNQAFESNKYVAYASENVYLNDNQAFIDKLTAPNRYLATLKYQDKEYAIREYVSLGVVYCDNRADPTYPLKISVTTDDHNINYVMLRRADNFIKILRWYFEKGCFRFRDLKCKEALLKAISY